MGSLKSTCSNTPDDLLMVCRWQESLKRFEHIFDQSEGGVEPGRQTPRIPTYTLPGNHDLGYEAMETANTEVPWFFHNSFGAVSSLLYTLHFETLLKFWISFFDMVQIGCRRWSVIGKFLAHWSIMSLLEV